MFLVHKFIRITLLIFLLALKVQAWAVGDHYNDAWPQEGPLNKGTVFKGINKAVKRGKFGKLDSLLIVKDGELLFEQYYRDGRRDKPHKLKSAGKSILSAVVGIAVDQGLIHEDISVYEFFQPHVKQYEHWDERKANLKIRHLLMMSAGWECGDIMKYRKHCGYVMKKKRDPYKWVLDLPMRFEPGAEMDYIEAAPAMLGAMVTLASNQLVQDFSKQYLFEPLGIQSNYYKHGLTTREFARFALLYLNQGRWGDKQVISKAWVRRSTAPHILPPPKWRDTVKDPYGYLWWIRRFKLNGKVIEGYSASGNGGQMALILPGLKMVVVTTGQDYNNLDVHHKLYSLVENHILPKVAKENF